MTTYYSNVPRIYLHLRQHASQILVAGVTALLWRSAPAWVIAIVCVVLLTQFLPSTAYGAAEKETKR